MKLLHLADLHLGKRVHEFSMLEDQRYILKQILEIMETEQADGVLVAGDIYDKTVPSAEAVQLLDDFLTNIAGRKIPVFLISGNHDSAERISFGAKLFAKSGVYFASGYQGKTEVVTLEDDYGKVNIYLLPFVRPVYVRQAFPELAERIVSYQDAMQTVMGHIDLNRECRNVLVAHQFVTGAVRCESEEIQVGGLDNVEASLFADFDYVALGHIHGPQWILRETMRYAGTPLKYSFSEVCHQKAVTVIELRAKGDVEIRKIPLRPLHDMRKIRGSYEELTKRSVYENTSVEDYVQITLTDEEDIFDAVGKLRVIYPNLMKIEYDNRRTGKTVEAAVAENVERTPLEYTKALFSMQNERAMSLKQEKYLVNLIEEVWGDGL
ncbi:MAG: exonuclease SbcCD subunit D [Lachnospiraceae bacterium]|nr:exonuclease SbcCD subunit D [Lachnospiraceae bacterium]